MKINPWVLAPVIVVVVLLAIVFLTYEHVAHDPKFFEHIFRGG